MRRQCSYTDEDKVQIRTLLLDGVSQKEIEKHLEIPQPTISRWRSEWIEANTEISEELRDTELRIAHRFDNVVQSKLVRVEAGEEEISMQLGPRCLRPRRREKRTKSPSQ